MNQKEKILIVDNDQIIQQLLNSIFSEYQVEIVESGESAVKLIDSFIPDLVIIENNLTGIDGYETCKVLKENNNTKNTSVFFVTDSNDLDGRIQAYGAGADDYLTKPFDLIEFKAKIDKVLSLKNEREDLSQQLQSSYHVALDMQKNASKIQVISRFLEANLCCHDIPSLCELFFKTTKELDASCVIKVKLANEILVLSDNDFVHAMESEILEMSGQLERIHSFGKDRSVFNWDNVSVLVRNIGENIDIMAILMNGLEAGIRSIETETKLLTLVNALGDKNNSIQENISILFSELKLSLADIFMSLGFVTTLDTEDEEKLNTEVDVYHQKITEQLMYLNINNDKVSSLINELKTTSVQDQDDEIDGVSLF